MTREDNEAEIITEQHAFKKLPFAGYMEKLERRRKECEKKGIKWEFQEVGIEMENWFNPGKDRKKTTWWLWYKPYMDNYKAKKALETCKMLTQSKVKEYRDKSRELSYFIGIIKKS